MRENSMVKKVFSSKEVGILIPWILICVITSIANPAFISFNNVINLLRSVSITLIGSIGVTFVLIWPAFPFFNTSCRRWNNIIRKGCRSAMRFRPMGLTWRRNGFRF